jgi:adenylosuccinate lyase
MRTLFSEINTRHYWRRIWASLAEAEADYNLVSRQEVEELKSKTSAKNIDLKRAHEIEEKIKHDLMAEIKSFSEQTTIGGGKIHLGATSADIEDNTDILKISQGLEIIFARLINCLDSIKNIIIKNSDLVCIGWTHLQPAEPTTLGYRFAVYAQDLVLDITNIENLMNFIKGKGLKGAVGTSASFKNLLKDKGDPKDLESKVMNQLGLDTFLVTNQTYPRKIDHLIISALSSISQTVHKLGMDIRVLQSPVFGEISEPIAKLQVGSSTMAFKRNPILSERMCSLSRYVASLVNVSFMNASITILERTLDDSANRRIIIPESFLSIDECLILYNNIIENLSINYNGIRNNLLKFGVFSGTEAILVEMVKKGENRQEIHEKIRKYSFEAWKEIMKGNENTLRVMLLNDPTIKSKLSSNELEKLLDPNNYTGNANERSRLFVKDVIDPILIKHSSKLGKTSKVLY